MIGIPLLITSKRFMLVRLKAMWCEDAIGCHGSITVDNVSGILLTSHCHNAIGLKNITLEFILKNLNTSAIIITRSLQDLLKTEPVRHNFTFIIFYACSCTSGSLFIFHPK